MSNQVQPVTRERHAALNWRGPDGYHFASAISLAPLAAPEVRSAMLSLPLSFVQHEHGWSLSAVLGLVPGQNLFVEPIGTWTGSYIPAAFRAHPFSVDWTMEGTMRLCVDEASGLLSNESIGQTMFEPSGDASQSLQQVWRFLTEIAQGNIAIARACTALQAAGLIEPWPITIQDEAGHSSVTHLHRINEDNLTKIDDTSYLSLRRAGVFAVAYAQLLSMGHINRLGQLARARAQAEAAARAKAAVKPMITLPEDSSIDWDWSKIGKI